MTLIGLERGCGPEIRKTSTQDSIGCLPISDSEVSQVLMRWIQNIFRALWKKQFKVMIKI